MEAALGAAFAADPPLSFLLGGEGREQQLRAYFRALIPLYGAPWISEGPAGAALWVPPGDWPLPATAQLAVLPALARVFAPHWRRALGALRALERHHIPEPHWYLDYVGIEPAGHGRGAASALLEPVLARADADRAPAYLNASSARSRDLYLRHGFVVLSELRLPFGGPPLWRMRREPRG